MRQSPLFPLILIAALSLGVQRPVLAQQGLSLPLQTIKAGNLDNLPTDTAELWQLRAELESTLGRTRRGMPLSQERALKALTAVCSYGYALNLAASGKPRSEWGALPGAFREELERTLKSKGVTLREQDLKEIETQTRELLSLLQQLIGGNQGRRGRANSASTARKKDDESKDIKESSGSETGASGGSGGSTSIKPGSGSTIPKGHAAPGLKAQVSIKIQQHAVALDRLMK
ncbi:hypothetical protein [Armatimonas rosea]|uniref:Uncharacterized protein n=1 Tax=Armatimonas rosea TaxID=685828 RepID=A0A7W9SRH7_ARMRO|nr:hypothetical protein [Armatimonas rosea]MBB6051100.1 hypothetical protein [Armatimonas rosea]